MACSSQSLQHSQHVQPASPAENPGGTTQRSKPNTKTPKTALQGGLHPSKAQQQLEGHAGEVMAASTDAGSPTQIMEAITDCKATLVTQIETVRIDLSLLKKDLQNLREKTEETERRISNMEDTVTPPPGG